MEDYEIPSLLKKIHDRMKTNFDAELKSLGLTFGQMRAMYVLEKSGGQLTQKQIADMLDVSHPTVVGIVGRMEKAGYVVCEKDPDDHRNKIVTLTQLALDKGREGGESHRQADARLVAGLSDEEKEVLLGLLNRVYENLENRGDDSGCAKADS
ncbi:MAG: MarR family transcriptional regulator [Eubacteriales bacterium]|jgi:DNA-binding MarR family transcriptional regulator